MLARLHGVPVVSVVLPGRRDDYAHLLGFGVSSALIAAWPPDATGMLPDLLSSVADRVRAVGAISRFGVPRPTRRRPGCPRVTVLLGRGGGAPSPEVLDDAQRQSPSWAWTVLGGEQGWQADPLPALLGRRRRHLSGRSKCPRRGRRPAATCRRHPRRPAAPRAASHRPRPGRWRLAGARRGQLPALRVGRAPRRGAQPGRHRLGWLVRWPGRIRAAQLLAVCHDRAPAEAVA